MNKIINYILKQTNGWEKNMGDIGMEKDVITVPDINVSVPVEKIHHISISEPSKVYRRVKTVITHYYEEV